MRTDSIQIGTLDDDLTCIAGAVHREIPDGPKMVWIDDQRCVFMGDPDESSSIAADWIAGTFGPDHSMMLIEEDLRALALDRSHDSMMD